MIHVRLASVLQGELYLFMINVTILQTTSPRQLRVTTENYL